MEVIPLVILLKMRSSISGGRSALRMPRSSTWVASVTQKRKLRELDFVFEGNKIRGLEQNPETKSRWAEMVRSGKKVMQFLSEGRYVANVADEKVTL
jgi:hypothetical protein